MREHKTRWQRLTVTTGKEVIVCIRTSVFFFYLAVFVNILESFASNTFVVQSSGNKILYNFFETKQNKQNVLLLGH